MPLCVPIVFCVGLPFVQFKRDNGCVGECLIHSKLIASQQGPALLDLVLLLLLFLRQIPLCGFPVPEDCSTCGEQGIHTTRTTLPGCTTRTVARYPCGTCLIPQMRESAA